MAVQFKNNFSKGITLDLDETRVPPNAAVFIKNLTDNVNANAAAASLAGSNQAVRTPIEGNIALPTSGSLPGGTNYCIGFYSSDQTNEGYFAIYNSNGNHSIWVVRGDTGSVEKVHQNTLLPFTDDPDFFLSEGRMTLELRSVIDPSTLEETNFKLLIFTNNRVLQCLIDVEASLATGSYTTTYFTASAAFYDRLELIHLTPPLPVKCVKLNDPTSYTPQPEDENKQNLLVNQGWQFRIRTWDVFGRPSEWGIISSVYTSLVGGGCIATSNGLPRCVNLCFDAGNPLVKFITVAYRRWTGNDPYGAVESEWLEHETFRKYDDSTGVQWYQRPINPLFTTIGSGITFDAGTNIITYTFCADKGSNPIDSEEASRTEPGTPRWSGSAFAVDKRIGLANNVYGFQPVNQEVTDAIDFTLKTPDPDSTEVPCDAADPRTIVVYAVLYNAFGDYYPLIRNQIGGFVTFGDGGNTLGPGDTTCLVSNYKLGQVFADQVNPGFIAYLAGTPYSVIGEWGNLDPGTGTFTPQPTFPGSGSFPNIKATRFTFENVPAGKYIVRLASHHAKKTDGNLQQTSTQVWGIAQFISCTVAHGPSDACYNNPSKEIVVNCTGSDAMLDRYSDNMFVILDLNNGVRSNGVDGYLYEQVGGAPIEMAVTNIYGSTLGALGDGLGSFFTDHNGYYFGTSGSDYCHVDVYTPFCTSGIDPKVFSIQAGCGGNSTTGKMTHGDGTGPRDPDFFGNGGYWFNKVYVARPGGVISEYPDAERRFIKQRILSCGSTTIGVPGIPVIMTKGQAALTDSTGTATILAHNRYDYRAVVPPAYWPFGTSLIPNYGTSPGNQDLLIFSQKGGCQWNSCDGSCNTSMADVTVTYLGCGVPASGCTTAQPIRTLCLSSLSAQPNGVGISGLQSGGKYGAAYMLHDVIGRHTAPQVKGGELGFVYTPNLNDTTPTPYPAMALCKLQVTIPSGLTVDPVFTKITFLVGANCLFYDFFSWQADWVQFVDNTGTTNTVNPTSIRIYFQSLNEYNKQYNFKTNVAWDFITTSADPSVPRDVVQFIMNGDGDYLPSLRAVPITYDKAGSFFTVDYIPELSVLQNGCLFRVIRPKQNTSGQNQPYFEQCLTLTITNGQLPEGTWTLPYQDSYLLSRSIPVPRLKGQSGPVPPGTFVLPEYTSTNQDATLATDGFSTNNVANNNNVVIFQTVDDPLTFPFFFESPSPSDLWGSHLFTKGRVGFVNPYEQQYRVGTEIALSNVMADRGIVNGIGTYTSGNKEVFDRNTWGDIVSVLVETSVCLVICEKDHFSVTYNMTQLQLTENGIVGKNQYGPFSSPSRKAGSNYGCDPYDINTIRRYAGVVRWLDSSGYIVLHNFSSADSNTDDAGYLGYILNKIGVVNIKNQSPSNGKTFFLGGIDIKNMEYCLTSFTVPQSGTPSYINNQSQPNLASNETLVFDLGTARLKSFASFTPEYYGYIPSYFSQRQFLSFKGGIPYVHHHNLADNATVPPYCNFYGTQCEVRLTHLVNGAGEQLVPDKVKRFLANELYVRQSIAGASGTMPSAIFYADVILSEKGQTSRLLVGRWDLKDGYQCAAYVCATNTPPDPNMPEETGIHAILDGDPLQGRWLKVSLTNNTLWAGTYFELSEVVNYINGVEKSAD